MMNHRSEFHTIAAVLAILVAAVVLVESDRQAAGRRIQAASSGFSSPCGSGVEIAARIGKCLQPIFDLVEGNFDPVKGDADIVSHCNNFNTTDRCVKTISKDCLSGIHKTATSSIGTAIKRFKTSECKNESTRSRYIAPLQCGHDKTGKSMATLYRNYTSILQTARDMPIGPEQKLAKVCCSLIAMDKEIERIYNAACPENTAAILGIVHAITDDARNVLCVSPKCQGVLTGIQPTRLKQQQNFIEPAMQVLFQLADA